MERLKDFRVREYILTPRDRQALYFGLFDIIAAYCYDHRTTEGESTSESAWTINKLSATLSWFEVITFSVTKIHMYFVIDSVRKLLDMLLYFLVGRGW
jgi:protein SHQ1